MLVRSGAGIYATAAGMMLVEAAIPGGQAISIAASLIAVLLAATLLLVGRRVPRRLLAVSSPLGATLIAYALADAHTYTDAAILYSWPVMWTAYFYGTRATALTVGWTGVVHALALLSMPTGVGQVDRWIDVMVSVSIIAGVIRVLAARRDQLVVRLKEEARIDPLTGLLNRRGLTERLNAEIVRANREGHPLAAVTFDVDHFKSVNDVHGHDTGDRVLAWVADTIRRETRVSDLSARLGGDEFLVILPTAGVAEARAFAERVRAAMHAESPTTRSLPEALQLSVSAGVAVAVKPSSPSALTGAADQALYAAKREGRDTTAVA